jgi:hypothetical protein
MSVDPQPRVLPCHPALTFDPQTPPQSQRSCCQASRLSRPGNVDVSPAQVAEGVPAARFRLPPSRSGSRAGRPPGTRLAGASASWGRRRFHARNYAELHPLVGRLEPTGCDAQPPSPPPPQPALPPPPPPPPPTTTRQTCAPSYSDECIPPPPPDLDCKDIPYRNFRVLWNVPDPDPHHFDGDQDGIGCETK